MPSKSNPRATAKLAQNSALSARWEKGICILCCNSGSRPCELGAKQTIFQDEPGGRLHSRLRGSREAKKLQQNKNVRMRENFRDKPRRLKIGANAHECLYFLTGFTFIERAVATYALHGQCSFLLTVLAFRCPLSVYSQIDIGCGIKL